MRKHFTLFSLLIAMPLAGCGSDPATEKPFDKGDPAGQPSLSSPYAQFGYPEGPYAGKVGSVVPNLEFLGWQNPVAVGSDVGQFEKLSFAKYYDPNGSKGYSFMLISVVGAWCPPCRAEYGGKVPVQGSNPPAYHPSMQKLSEEYAKKGVVFLGALVDDVKQEPAKPADLSKWTTEFGVGFPMVVDPGRKTGKFFTNDALPATMIVNLKTMRLEAVFSGANLLGILGKLDALTGG